jgi:hypothetical protein
VEGYQDAHVLADSPSARHASASRLVVGGSPRHEAYLSFRVEPPSGHRVKSARLRLFAPDGTDDGPKVYRAAPYDEDTVTYATRPALTSGVLADTGAIATSTFVEYDLGAAVTAGENHFALVPDSTEEAAFFSTEADYELPQLLVTYEAVYCARRTKGGATAWVRHYGTSGGEAADGIAFNAAGELFMVAGGYNPSGDFGGGSVPAAALVKYAADGTHLWTRALPAVHAIRVLVTGEGNLFVVGRYLDAPDFGSGPLPDAARTANGLFVAKYSPSGQFVWARGFVPSGSSETPYAYPHAVATDANGSLLVAGSLRGQVSFGGALLRAGTVADGWEQPGLFVLSLRWDGEHQWSRATQTEQNFGTSLATDGAGNVWLGGSSREGMDLGGGPVSARRYEPFVARYTPDGTLQWVRVIAGVQGAVEGLGVPEAADADAFISGAWRGAFRFAGVDRSHPDATRGYLGRISPSGGERWARQVGTAYELNGLALDGEGNPVLHGLFEGEADFGTGVLGGAGLEMVPFVASYTPTGEPRWSRALDPLGRWITDLAVHGTQPLVLLNFSEAMTVDRVLRPSRGQYDVMLLRLSP